MARKFQFYGNKFRGEVRIMWGQLRIIQGDWEKFKYEVAYKISWRFEKVEGARLSGGPVTEGCSTSGMTKPNNLLTGFILLLIVERRSGNLDHHPNFAICVFNEAC